MTRTRAVILAFVAVSALLLARSWVMESVQFRSHHAGAAPSVYDPPSYYQLVNDEIAPHLAYCPLIAGTGPLGTRAREIDAQFYRRHSIDEIDPTSVDARRAQACSCSDRLGPLFCLRDDEPVDERLRDRIQRYARMSPLLADLAVPSRWTLEPRTGPLLSVVPRLLPGSHRQRLPGTAEDLAFTGTVFFRDSGERVVLIDESGRRHMLDVATSGADNVPLFRAPPAGPGSVEFARLVRHARVLRFTDEEGDTKAEFAAVPSSEPQLLVVLRQTSGLQVYVEGIEVPAHLSRRVFALEQGQQIRFVRGSQESSFRLSAARLGVVSEMRYSAHGAVRVTDDSAGVSDLVNALTGSMGDLLGRLQQAREESSWPAEQDSRSLASTDVWLTLDAGLQRATQQALLHYAEDPRSTLNRSDLVSVHFRDGLWVNSDPSRSTNESPRAVPPHLGLVVLDADAGDVLALGSYPDVRSVRGMLERLSGEDDVTTLLRTHLRAELARGSLHLSEHVIGSIFKPLFAWSAGGALPALVDFTIDPSHDRDWRTDPRANRLLDQCFISTRKLRARGASSRPVSHFHAAYAGSSAWLSCGAQTPAGREDVCMALARSDTYWFLELAARTLAASRAAADGKSPASVLPTGSAGEAERDLAYRVASYCAPQTMPETGVALCTGGAKRVSVGFPGVCENQPHDPFCSAMERLGVQHQSVTLGARQHDAVAVLGPLVERITRLLNPTKGNGVSGECVPLRERPQDAFRWVAPTKPQWSADVLDGCTPGIESFVEGGGLNYWNNLHLAQALGRMYLDDPALGIRLISLARSADGRVDAAPAETNRRMRPIAKTLVPGSVHARVLEGLRLAVTDGTLHHLRNVAPALTPPGGTFTVDLRGKTGTIRAPYPVILRREEVRRRPRWIEDVTTRKSMLTALLLEVGTAERARHFVVLLWIEGLDGTDTLTAAEVAGRFFDREGPGFAVLGDLVELARVQLATRREGTP